MKKITKHLAIGLFLFTISVAAFAQSYPLFTGNLSEVNYRVVASDSGEILVEIDGVIYRVKNVK